MTSKIVVNNIEADSGISTVTFNSNISGNFVGNVNTTGVSTFSNIRVTGGTISGVSTAGITTAYIGSVNGGPISGARNRIINGDMRIDQRNNGSSGTATGVYTVDRWFYYATQASKGTWQQNAGSVTPPVGFTNYLGYTSSSAYTLLAGDIFGLSHIIEGYNISDLAFGTASAKPVTLSFWVRSSLNGQFGGFLKNGGNDISGNNTRYCGFIFNVNVANTWEYKTITFPGDTSGSWDSTNGPGLAVAFSLGSGSTSIGGTALTWGGTFYQQPSGSNNIVATNGATFYITGVQLEQGTVATEFERRSTGQELALCQRYFCKSSDPNVIATVGGTYTNTGMFYGGTINAYGANAGYSPFTTFPVTMRIAPYTVTFIPTNLGGTTTGQWSIYNVGGPAWTTGTVSIQSATMNGFNVQCSGTWSAGAALMYGAWTASAEL